MRKNKKFEWSLILFWGRGHGIGCLISNHVKLKEEIEEGGKCACPFDGWRVVHVGSIY